MRILEIQEKLTFSGTAADQKRVSIPKAYIRAVIVSVVSNVTDAGISSGETLDGCVNFMRFGDQQQPILYAERDELAQLAAVTAPDGYDAGSPLVTDAMPTTATDNFSQFIYYGPFDTRKCAAPGFTLALRTITDEFGGASAFTATVTITLLVEDAPLNALAYKYPREYRATSLRHELSPPTGYIATLFTKVSATSYYKRITAQAADGSLSIDVSNAYAMQQIYSAKAAVAAASAAGIAFIPCECADAPERKIIVELSTTSVLLAFIRQVV